MILGKGSVDFRRALRVDVRRGQRRVEVSQHNQMAGQQRRLFLIGLEEQSVRVVAVGVEDPGGVIKGAVIERGG